MTYIEAIILGIVQGITEFLPISSSGHLVLTQNFLNIDNPGNEIEVLVHMGTLASIFVVFFKDIKFLIFGIKSKSNQFFILLLLFATVPSIIIGFTFKDMLESFFDNSVLVSFALILTGLILISSKYFKPKNINHNIFSAIIIGFAQALAIIPGISRSGMTICCALLLGINAKEAARFSFLMAIPVISGAGLLTFVDANHSFSILPSVGFASLISSFVVGIVALKWLLKWLAQGKFHYFGFYCILIGMFSLVS